MKHSQDNAFSLVCVSSLVAAKAIKTLPRLSFSVQYCTNTNPGTGIFHFASGANGHGKIQCQKSTDKGAGPKL
jgi:hypothetical protein